MASDMIIYWDLLTCPLDSWHRIGIVVESIRRLYVLPKKYEEKLFVCFGLQHNDCNEDIKRDLRIEFRRIEKQINYWKISCEIKSNLMDNKTSLVLISSNRYLIEDIINWKSLAPIHLIYTKSLNIQSIRFPNNVKSLRFEKFSLFCLGFSDYIQFFYNLNFSDPSEEERNPIEEQKDGFMESPLETLISKISNMCSSFKRTTSSRKTNTDFESTDQKTGQKRELSETEMAQKNNKKKKDSEEEEKQRKKQKEEKEKERNIEMKKREEMKEREKEKNMQKERAEVKQRERTRQKDKINLGVCGLENLGNTCYMNSALQCLSNVSPLSEFVHQISFEFENRNKRSNQRPLISIYCDLIHMMWSGDNEVVDPKQFKDKISKLWDQFRGWDQNDCAELVSSVLDKFHEELLSKQTNRKTTTESSYQTFDDYLEDNNTFIAQTFHSFQRYQLIHECGHNLTDENQSLSIINLPQIYKINAIPLILILKNKSVYKIELRLAENTISIIDLLRETIQTFNEYNEYNERQTLNENNMIAVLIKDHLINTIYETNSVINFDKIDGHLYIYERDPLFQLNVFVILMSSEPFGIPLLLNFNECTYESILNHFYDQMIPLLKDSDKFDYFALYRISVSKYNRFSANSFDSNNSDQCSGFHIWTTDPIDESTRAKYRYPKVICIKSKETYNYKLEDSLKHYLSFKQLDDKVLCIECKKDGYPKGKMSLLYSPKVLILRLKSNPKFQRFPYICEFPLILNFDEYLSDNKQMNDPNTYDLIAIANYSGSSYGGHYYAYAKNHINNKWYNFNDSRVNEIDERQLISSKAYLLFYLKR